MNSCPRRHHHNTFRENLSARTSFKPLNRPEPLPILCAQHRPDYKKAARLCSALAFYDTGQALSASLSRSERRSVSAKRALALVAVTLEAPAGDLASLALESLQPWCVLRTEGYRRSSRLWFS